MPSSIVAVGYSSARVAAQQSSRSSNSSSTCAIASRGFFTAPSIAATGLTAAEFLQARGRKAMSAWPPDQVDACRETVSGARNMLIAEVTSAGDKEDTGPSRMWRKPRVLPKLSTRECRTASFADRVRATQGPEPSAEALGQLKEQDRRGQTFDEFMQFSDDEAPESSSRASGLAPDCSDQTAWGNTPESSSPCSELEPHCSDQTASVTFVAGDVGISAVLAQWAVKELAKPIEPAYDELAVIRMLDEDRTKLDEQCRQTEAVLALREAQLKAKTSVAAALERHTETLEEKIGTLHHEKAELASTLHCLKDELQSVADSQYEGQCVICLTGAASYAVVPCGHLSLCDECVTAQPENCPVCRTTTQNLMRIYKA